MNNEQSHFVPISTENKESITEPDEKVHYTDS